MSESVTVGGVSATIYGTYTAAVDYVSLAYGDTYTAWTALSADNRKRTLVAATRYLDAQTWSDDYDTFAERDSEEAFQLACYEMAVIIAADPSVVTQLDAGSNIQSVGAGGASVTYFAPTTDTYVLPPVVHRLLASYLGGRSGATTYTALSSTGSSCNAFTDDYEREEP